MNLNTFKKGLKNILIAFFFMFLGPTMLFQSFKNQNHPWFEIIFSISLVICVIALLYGVNGLKKIVDSIFKK